MSKALQKELEVYEKELQNLLSEQGKFVLIHGEEIQGTYETYEDALNVGYSKYGIKPFLVKKIMANEEVQYFTRDLGTSCHV